MKKRIEVLKDSLIKKEALLTKKLSDHFKRVAEANGQPLNDKRGGQATLKVWDQQRSGIRTLELGIEVTKSAIVAEEQYALDVEHANKTIPDEILRLVEDGVLQQWKKHPTTFFVVGVDKARIVWDTKRKVLCHRYYDQVRGTPEGKIFALLYNQINKVIEQK